MNNENKQSSHKTIRTAGAKKGPRQFKPISAKKSAQVMLQSSKALRRKRTNWGCAPFLAITAFVCLCTGGFTIAIIAFVGFIISLAFVHTSDDSAQETIDKAIGKKLSEK